MNVEPTPAGYTAIAALFRAEQARYAQLANRLMVLRTTIADTDATPWQELPAAPVADWQDDVANGDTRLGYAAWAAQRSAG